MIREMRGYVYIAPLSRVEVLGCGPRYTRWLLSAQNVANSARRFWNPIPNQVAALAREATAALAQVAREGELPDGEPVANQTGLRELVSLLQA